MIESIIVVAMELAGTLIGRAVSAKEEQQKEILERLQKWTAELKDAMKQADLDIAKHDADADAAIKALKDGSSDH